MVRLSLDKATVNLYGIGYYECWAYNNIMISHLAVMEYRYMYVLYIWPLLIDIAMKTSKEGVDTGNVVGV